MGSMLEIKAREQVSSEYSRRSCQFLFHQILHIHLQSSSMAATMDQIVSGIPSGHSLTLSCEINQPINETELENRIFKARHSKMIFIQFHPV
jgi:hypothetical protein